MYIHVTTTRIKTYTFLGSSLEVQWLGLWAFTAMAWVQSLAWGNKIPQATLHSWKKKKKKIYTFPDIVGCPRKFLMPIPNHKGTTILTSTPQINFPYLCLNFF